MQSESPQDFPAPPEWINESHDPRSCLTCLLLAEQENETEAAR